MVRRLHTSIISRWRLGTGMREKQVPPLKPSKEVFIENFHDLNKEASSKRMKGYVSDNPDPLSPMKTLVKATVTGFCLATICSVSYAAYDPGYRATMRTTYPLGTWLLDLMMVKEGEMTGDKEDTSQQAAAFKEDIMKGVK